ncbi:unnamed protein product [Polarella glacialis]|uniref:Uncharacterized protein n=1 Tax=Polarella glacialis TaxID=89957 RepID=A0A813LLY6_POLGL|nr:unnamed protein product [Polarella glacialis]CAE8737525.1 unnamed protein product [Polarella glacialis]
MQTRLTLNLGDFRAQFSVSNTGVTVQGDIYSPGPEDQRPWNLQQAHLEVFARGRLPALATIRLALQALEEWVEVEALLVAPDLPAAEFLELWNARAERSSADFASAEVSNCPCSAGRTRGSSRCAVLLHGVSR